MTEISAEPAAPPSAVPAPDKSLQTTVFGVIFTISGCHLLNDMMQALLPAIYPNLKIDLNLSYGQIGLVTLAYQITASILQPVVGAFADRRPTPMALPGGTLFSLAGLAVLSMAHAYWMVIVGASMLGMGSSVFHPESSRVARMAAGPRHGLAQSVFQVGGNTGQALGPLAAALFVVHFGQSSLLGFALLALLNGAILWNVGMWYKHKGLPRLHALKKAGAHESPVTDKEARRGIFILLVLIFSKYVYLASITSYFTLYLIDHYGLSVRAAQLHLFLFSGAVAVGTFAGGPIGDRFGRKLVIWASILGVLPFTLLLPYASLFWTAPLTIVIGLLLASAFPAIVVFAQELMPGRVGMIAGMFFGFSFGIGGLGAAALGFIADHWSIDTVYHLCAFLPAIGMVAALLPDLKRRRG